MNWQDNFDERERRLISNCVDYATSDPAGLPAHNIMIIVAKMVKLLNQQAGENAENIRQPEATPGA